METLKGALSAILLEHAPAGSTGLVGADPEKIEELVRLVFSADFSEAEFRRALDSHFHSGE